MVIMHEKGMKMVNMTAMGAEVVAKQKESANVLTGVVAEKDESILSLEKKIEKLEAELKLQGSSTIDGSPAKEENKEPNGERGEDSAIPKELESLESFGKDKAKLETYGLTHGIDLNKSMKIENMYSALVAHVAK